MPTRTNAHRLASLTVLLTYGIWLFHYQGVPSWARLAIGRAVEVASGLAGIAIAIVILIAENLRDGDPDARGRASLQASLAFPVMSGALIVLLTGALWPEGVWLQFFPLAVLVGVAFAGIYRLLRLLLRPGAMERAQDKLLSADFRQAQQEVLVERVGNVLLSQITSKFSTVQLQPGALGLPKAQYPDRFLARASGVVADIDLEALHRLEVDIAKASPSPTVGGPVEGTAESTTSTESDHHAITPIAWLTVRFRGIVDLETPLLVVNPAAERPMPPAELVQAALDRAIVIGDERLLDDSFDRIVNDLDSRTAAAITSGDRKGVRAGARQFRLLTKEYLALLKSMGAQFDADAARQEQQSLGGMLETVDAPATSVVSLLELAVNQRDREILFEVMTLPYSICTSAIRAQDALLLTRHAQVIERLMELSYAPGTVDDHVGLVRDRAWRYYSELAGLHLDLLLEASPDVETRAFVVAAVDILLASFGQSMKTAADHGDVETLRVMTLELNRFGPRLTSDQLEDSDPDHELGDA